MKKNPQLIATEREKDYRNIETKREIKKRLQMQKYRNKKRDKKKLETEDVNARRSARKEEHNSMPIHVLHVE
jgi:hypothetical protein